MLEPSTVTFPDLTKQYFVPLSRKTDIFSSLLGKVIAVKAVGNAFDQRLPSHKADVK